MKILHIIDSMTAGGGAQSLLAGVLDALDKENNSLVVFDEKIDFEEVLKDIKTYYIPFKGWSSLPQALWSLNKIIKKETPNIIHTHLPLATSLVRLCRLQGQKHIFTIHGLMNASLRKTSPHRFVEQYFFNKKSMAIFVSKVAQDDYLKINNKVNRKTILYNHVSDAFFQEKHQKKNLVDAPRKFVAVGGLRFQKNYPFLIKVFKRLAEEGFTLDILGEGSLRPALEAQIDKNRNIKLLGNLDKIEEKLSHYDAFIAASTHEGFGIAAMEAATLGLPLYLSDIEVFREVTQGEVLYFNPKDEEDLCALLINTAAYKMKYLQAENPTFLIVKKYKKKEYIKELKTIYKSILTEDNA